MGLLFGRDNITLTNKEITDRTFGFNAHINTALGNKGNKKSKKQIIEKIQQGFFDLFNQVVEEEDNLLEGIYTYAKLEEAALDSLTRNNKELLEKYNIDLYKYALEPKADESLNTDSSTSYINKGFKKMIADWPNEKFESLINQIGNHAKKISETRNDLDLTDYRNQINALKDAKKERSFGRRIKEFFNGTWWRQNKMIKELDSKLKENFVREIHEERIRRENLNKEENIKGNIKKENTLENEKKKISVQELDESEIDYDELTDEQFEELNRKIDAEIKEEREKERENF